MASGAWASLRSYQRIADYLFETLGRNDGFDEVIASELEVVEGVVTGRLKGLNCWGPEKTRRLKESIGETTYTLYAYGNSRGDKELLEMADYPFYKTFPLG